MMSGTIPSQVNGKSGEERSEGLGMMLCNFHRSQFIQYNEAAENATRVNEFGA